jgi:hypothetical protein
VIEDPRGPLRRYRRFCIASNDSVLIDFNSRMFIDKNNMIGVTILLEYFLQAGNVNLFNALLGREDRIRLRPILRSSSTLERLDLNRRQSDLCNRAKISGPSA